MSRQRGQQAEQRAAAYLCEQGLQLVARNWHCRYGELDLILLDPEQTLIFVEVRYRVNSNYGSALESITPAKQEKILLAAQSFLQHHQQWQNTTCRFDVVAITGNPPHHGELQWLQHAFML